MDFFLVLIQISSNRFLHIQIYFIHLFRTSFIIIVWSIKKNIIEFPTSISEIHHRIQSINPIQYRATRNFGNGAITQLSPYISRGAISTSSIFEHLKTLNLQWFDIEGLVQQLAWRDYFQNVWKVEKDGIFSDLKQPQENVESTGIPTAILKGETGI